MVSQERGPEAAGRRDVSRVPPTASARQTAWMRSPAQAAAPPPRPPLTRGAPPPIPPITQPSALTRAGRGLWWLSVLAGGVALTVAFLRRTDQFRRLRTMVEDLQPGSSAETVDTVATIAFWGTFGMLVLFLAAELLLRSGTERSARARWSMLLVLVLHSAAAAGTVPFVALGTGGTSTRVLLVLQLALAGAALLLTTVAASLSRRRPREPATARARRLR